MSCYITPKRTGIPIRYALAATDEAAAHAEARQIGAAFGSYIYCIRSES